MNNLRILFVILSLVFLQNSVSGQFKNAGNSSPVPSVFFIGEYEDAFEKMVKDYNTLLFTVCDNSMELTSDNWALFLMDLEEYATTMNMDLKGTKYWLNVFWNKNGSIDNIAFFPKPNSKNMNYEDIRILLTGFIKNYQSPLKHKAKFSHYGSASFPVFSKASLAKEK